MKKLITNHKLLCILILIGLIGITCFSYALSYSEIRIANQYKVKTYHVELREEFNNDWGTKKVFFDNKEETNTDVVLRINYNEIWSKKIEDQKIILNNNIGDKNLVLKNFTSSFLNDFILSEDGWYYYKKILKAKESVQVLESISKNDDIFSLESTISYQDADYELSFNFEAIQASEKAIEEIWGQNVHIENDTVNWQI